MCCGGGGGGPGSTDRRKKTLSLDLNLFYNFAKDNGLFQGKLYYIYYNN